MKMGVRCVNVTQMTMGILSTLSSLPPSMFMALTVALGLMAGHPAPWTVPSSGGQMKMGVRCVNVILMTLGTPLVLLRLLLALDVLPVALAHTLMARLPAPWIVPSKESRMRMDVRFACVTQTILETLFSLMNLHVIGSGMVETDEAG